MAGARFQMSQGNVKSISNPARIAAIGGDNATEFYLKFRDMPPGQQWVFPFTYGFMYLVEAPGYYPVHVDASQVPAGAPTPATTSKIADLIAYDTEKLYSPGIAAVAAGVNKTASLGSDAPAAGYTATDTNGGAHFPVANALLYLVTWNIRGTAAGVVDDVTAVIRGVTSGTNIALSDIQHPGGVGTILNSHPFIPPFPVRNFLPNDTFFDVGVSASVLGTGLFVRGLVLMAV
jgi:hypothetical protein